MGIAIAHDYLNQMGGAEKVVEVMHGIYPEAPVYTSLYDPDKVSPRFQEMDVRTSFMQKLPLSRSHFRSFLPLYPLAFESFDFRAYDTVLSSSSAFAKGIVTGTETCHICYCYTPMRFAWSYHQYVQREHFGRLIRAVLPAVIGPLRLWDQATSRRVDYFIAISNAVAERIRKHYGRESEIIYPPVDTSQYLPASDSVGDYFLVVSRLIPYKRIDLAVEAFNRTGLPLKIVGEGREMNRLRAMARSNIEFVGWVPNDEVRRYFAHCRAFIFPGEEDFGLTPVEAQACGRPVIAYAAGGALETVADGVTGLFFKEQTPESLVDALNRFNASHFDPERAREQALKFDVSVFRRQLSESVARMSAEYHSRYHTSAQ